MVLKVKIVQESKKPKVEIYELIWDLVFNCNDNRRQFNSIQLSQEYIEIKENERKKNQIRT
jgi:hypothetical protein